MLKLYQFIISLLLIATQTVAQTKLNGTVRDTDSKEGLPGVSIRVKNSSNGTITNQQGVFGLTLSRGLPVTLVVSSVGYKTEEVTVQKPTDAQAIYLSETRIIAEEVVVAGSRIEESYLKSVATIEKLGIRDIKRSPAVSYYDALRNLKGITVSTNSVFFNTINIRGTGSLGNTSIAQLTDGMDNQAPGLNFSLGDVASAPGIDVENVEVVPGASSALYGSAAVSGAILIKSKNHFTYQGLSAELTTGLMNASNRTWQDGSRMGSTPIYDYSVRYAKAFTDKFAFKVVGNYRQAQDWQATDFGDMSYANGFNYETGNASNNPGYDGVNVYGDYSVGSLADLRPLFSQIASYPVNQLPTEIGAITQGLQQLSSLTGVPISSLLDQLVPDTQINRTGYTDRSLVDYNAKNLRLGAAFHYKIKPNLELSLSGNYGSGTTVYTQIDRYSLRNFNMGQYKLELKGDNFFIRSYTTQERSGNSYSSGVQAVYMNETWKPSFDGTDLNSISNSWLPQYGFVYLGGALQTFSTAIQQALGAGQTPAQAYATALAATNSASGQLNTAARNYADNGRPMPGSAEFNTLAAKIADIPLTQGAKFLDRSNLYHTEGMYRFSKFKWADVLVGAAYRIFALNSSGTLFAINPATGKEFTTHEIGAYTQLQKAFLDDKIKLSAGARYDKNTALNGKLTPRIGVVYNIAGSHFLRASYQQGFKLPSSIQQYQDLIFPDYREIGGVKAVVDQFDLDGKAIVVSTGKTFQYKPLAPEYTKNIEIGYKTYLWGFLSMDFLYYHTRFVNGIGTVLVQKTNADGSKSMYSVNQEFTNEDNRYRHGLALGIEGQLRNHFYFQANFSRDVDNQKLFGTSPQPVVSSSGVVLTQVSPPFRWNAALGNSNLFKTGVSFQANIRYQPASLVSSPLINSRAEATSVRPYIPAVFVVDAQVSKKIPALKATFKAGGNNIGGTLYRTNLGGPSIGSMYYLSMAFDQLVK